MKKGWKIAGTIAGIAALAALLPYSCQKDEENDELTVKALLWKYTSQPDLNNVGERKIALDIGFQNPFTVENDDLLMDEDDDLILVNASDEMVEPEESLEAEEAPADNECIPF